MNGPIRFIFPATVVAMWALIAIGIAGGHWTGANWAMAGLTLASCTVVFVIFVYVFSYGYGLSMIATGMYLAGTMPSAAAVTIAVLAAAFGLRLCWFVHARYQTAAYAGNKARGAEAHAAMPAPVKVYLWIAVSTLMTFEAMPMYRIAVSGVLNGWVLAGAAIMAFGLWLETVADQQKQVSKARDPGGFARDGLYRWVRQPNYLGEIVFQLGLIVAAQGSASGWYARVTTLVAPGYIIVLMYYAAQDSDRRRAERLTGDQTYRDYVRRTGRLLPGF
jgi:steroid 5-alpha reductase family enzyme